MSIVNLRRVGGSLMIALPKQILDEFALDAGAQLSIEIDDDAIKLKSLPKDTPKYTLQELLDQCDFSVQAANEEHEWLNAVPVGSELV